VIVVDFSRRFKHLRRSKGILHFVSRFEPIMQLESTIQPQFIQYFSMFEAN